MEREVVCVQLPSLSFVHSFLGVFESDERVGDALEEERYPALAIPRRPVFHEARMGFVRVAS